MLPIDLVEVFRAKVQPDDQSSGLLRASSDLVGSLRHSQLRLANAPVNERALVSDIRALHGELWHEWFHDTLVKQGIPFFYEVKLNEYMPVGWGGRADWVFWHPARKAFVLCDFKTTKGEALFWIENYGAKKEHLWQVSAYYYALLKMGLPMVKGFSILYWPMNDTPDKEIVLPSVQDCEPIDQDLLEQEMSTRYEKCAKYLDAIDANRTHFPESINYLQKELAPVQEREQKLYWSKVSKTFEAKLMPHWSARFCPYPDELCDCNLQGTTKIGQYRYIRDGGHPAQGHPDIWVYEARKGYEDITPTVVPSKSEQLRRRKEIG